MRKERLQRRYEGVRENRKRRKPLAAHFVDDVF